MIIDRNRPRVDVAVLVLALALAVLPLAPAYAGGVAVLPLAGGLAVGAVVAVVAARGRWSALSTLAVLLVVWVAAGGALAAPSTTVAGVVPTGETVRTLLAGVVTVWKEMLTLRAPLGAGGGLLVAPYALATAGAAAAVSVALRGRTAGRAAAAALVPVAVAAVAVLLGTRDPLLPLVTGVGGGVLLLTWASWRQGLLQPRRLVALAVAGVVVVLGGAVTGPVLAGSESRFVLRDRLTPPFDPRDYPSPLAGYRRYVKEWKDTELLTVRGLPAGADVRLATMDAYDGVVWNVSGQGTADGSGSFRRPADDGVAVGGASEASADGSSGAGSDGAVTAEVEVEVQALPGVWLPTVGEPRAVRFAGDAADDLAPQVRVNDATGAAVLTGGLTEGLRYTVDAVVPAVPQDAVVGAAAAAAVTLPAPRSVPDVVGPVASRLAGEASTPIGVARSLEAGLVERGWFSHGLTEAGDHPSLSGHGADRMTSLLAGELMVGDSEQYASAMALLARERGLPARVVLGFRAPQGPRSEAVTFTGDDAEAWVEIAFAGHGWVPFHPTPDESRTPDDQTAQDVADPQPQVVQPPPPVTEPVTPPEEDVEQPTTDEPADDAASGGGWLRVARVVGIGLVPVALLLVPAAVLEALRRRRRHRRRTTGDAVSRVVGGWEEVLDAAADLAVPVAAGGTRRETAADLAARTGPASTGPLTRLATSADAAVFAPGQPAAADVDGYWDTVAHVVESLRAAAPRGRRVRSRWSTASLRRRSGHRPRPVPSSTPASSSHSSPASTAPRRRPTRPPVPAPRALVPPRRDGES